MLFHLVIVAVSVECLLGDKSSESLSTDEEPLAGEYSDTIEGGLVETDPGYYNNYYADQAYAPYYQNYDTAYQHFGYDYGNELVEKQGTGPTAADFIPFFASFSLPLSAALATFIAIIVVSAAFLLFPQEIEIDVNSRRRRNADSCQDSQLCTLLQSVLHSGDCVEAVGCELARLAATSSEFPRIGPILRPLISQKFYERFRDIDCSSVKCQSRSHAASWEENKI